MLQWVGVLTARIEIGTVANILRPLSPRYLRSFALFALLIGALMIFPPRAGDAEVARSVAVGSTAMHAIATMEPAGMQTAIDEVPEPALPPPSADRRFSEAHRRCLATAIYHEARGESAEGQMAVAQVVLNRSAAGSWPADICAVVYQGSERRTGCQFSFACRRRLKNPSEDDPRWIKALSVTDALAAREGLLPEIETATHYHTVDVRPVWRLRLREVARIGRHIFYASDRNGSRRASLSEAAQSSGTR